MHACVSEVGDTFRLEPATGVTLHNRAETTLWIEGAFTDTYDNGVVKQRGVPFSSAGDIVVDESTGPLTRTVTSRYMRHFCVRDAAGDFLFPTLCLSGERVHVPVGSRLFLGRGTAQFGPDQLEGPGVLCADTKDVTTRLGDSALALLLTPEGYV